MCNQVQASAASAVGDYIAEHPEKLSKAKDVLKFGFKHSKTALRLTGKAGLKTAEVVKDHPFLALTGVAAVTGIALLSVDNAVEQIAKQPEALDNYLEKNPDKINKFVSKALKKYYDTKSQDKTLYSDLLDKIGIIDLDSPENTTYEKTKSEQDALEQTPEFIAEYDMLEKKADKYDQGHRNICTLDIAKRMVVNTGANFYKTNMNLHIPTLNNGLPEKYNIDQYWKLKSKAYALENDHIPSYEALKLFFLNKDKHIFIDKNGKGLPQTRNNKRYAYLNNNATAITIEYKLHRNNRTTGVRNIFYALTDSVDSKSLRIATFKDFATLLVLSKNDRAEYDKLKIAFLDLYARNKLLCIYDI